MPRARLGIVLPIPPPVADEIDGLRRALADPALTRIAPHITLVPPVNVPLADIPDVVRRVAAAAAVTAPLQLRIGPVRTFWPATPVLYLEVDRQAEKVRALHEQLHVGRPDVWPYVPHVTIGQDLTTDTIEWGPKVLSSYRRDVTVDRIELLQQMDARHWEVLADTRLAGA